MKLRSMILRGGLPALVLGLGLLTAGCGGGKPVLHIYNWTSYLKPELLRDFEQAHNCRVRMDHYDSNEAMYAKLKAGATGYDVIFPSSYMARIMNQQDMLQPIRHDLIPNLAHLDRDFLELTEDREMRYSVPYMVTASGIGYRADQLEAPEPTWGLFADPRFAGRMTLLNDMRETIGAALKFLGYSLNTTDETQLEAALEVLLTWKANIAKFESEQYKHGLASAEFFLAHGYNGDVLQVMEESPDVAWFFPQEGVSLASDDMVIPADARQVELAHAFINFIHDPAVAAANMEFVYYLCPNKPAYELIDPELRANEAVFPPADVLAKAEVIRDLGADNILYSRLWDRVKAGR